jgi:protein SHQ1
LLVAPLLVHSYSVCDKMPVTPEFTIHQDDEFLFVVIKVPFLRIKDTEIHTDGVDFTFYCKPYLLKLCFPHELEDCDDERCRAVYDPNTDNGVITAHLAKKDKGCHFPDLDLTTRLLALRSSNDKKLYSKDSDLLPSIEVLNTACDIDGTMDDESAQAGVNSILGELRLSRVPKYGFNLQYSDVLGQLKVMWLLFQL